MNPSKPAIKPPKRAVASVVTAKQSVAIAPAAGPQFWHYILGCVAALATALIVYGPALDGPFLLDDSYLPYALPQYANETLAHWMQGMRPVLMLSYWLNFQNGGESVYGYHLVNVLLHVANGLLIYFIVRKVLGFVRAEHWRREALSLFSAGLFLLHPLQTESVAYIASRSETLSVFFFLSAYAVFLYRRSVAATWLVVAAILVLFGLACLTKEHAAALPVLLFLTDYYWNPGFSFEGARKNWKVYLPFLAAGPAALFFIWRVLQSATTAGFALKDFTWYQYFFTECRAIWHYVLLFLFPFGQNIDHDFPVSRTIIDHGALVGLLALLAVIAAAWIYRKRYPLISYGVFTTLLLFAPTSSFVPLQDTLVERRMYLPFVGFLFVAAGLLRRWKVSRFTMAATLTVLLLIDGGLSYGRNQLWANAISIWSDSVAKSPQKWRPHFQLAYAYYAKQRCHDSLSEFQRTSQLGKIDYSLLVDWALAEDCAGNSSGALAKLQQAAQLNGTAHVYSQIGMEYAKLVQYPQALEALQKAEKLDPNFSMTYVYRGNVYVLTGDRKKAAADYQRALDLDPRNVTARDALLRMAR